MDPRVVVLGAGFGGLELAASLSELAGDDIELTLIDRSDHFVFGFGKLDVMFGGKKPAEVSYPYAKIDLPGVKFVQAEIEHIDPATRTVKTSAGTFEADYLVVALGADLDPAATPGLAEAESEFYTNAGAFSYADKLANFGGGRVVIGVAGSVFKCPPAPSETAILVDDYLRAKGLRDASEIALVMPLPAPVPPVPQASEGLLKAFEERGIEFHPGKTITEVDAAAGKLRFNDDSDMSFDLLLGVPQHVAPAVAESSGMVAGGWISVDPGSFRTPHHNVFAIGDIARTGTPKAGAFAEGQAKVVAAQIASEIGVGAGPDEYDGRGVCYVGFGGGKAAMVDVTFPFGAPPEGAFEEASTTLAEQKEDYRASRVARWFGL